MVSTERHTETLAEHVGYYKNFMIWWNLGGRFLWIGSFDQAFLFGIFTIRKYRLLIAVRCVRASQTGERAM